MKRTTAAWVVLLGVLAAVGAVGTRVAAQSPPPQAPPSVQAPQGQAPEGQGEWEKGVGKRETLPAENLVMSAYAFVWAVLLVFVWSIWRRLGRVEREMQDLSTRLATRPGRR